MKNISKICAPNKLYNHKFISTDFADTLNRCLIFWFGTLNSKFEVRGYTINNNYLFTKRTDSLKSFRFLARINRNSPKHYRRQRIRSLPGIFRHLISFKGLHFEVLYISNFTLQRILKNIYSIPCRINSTTL